MADQYISKTMPTGKDVKEALDKISQYNEASYVWKEIPPSESIDFDNVAQLDALDYKWYIVYSYLNAPEGITSSPIQLTITNQRRGETDITKTIVVSTGLITMGRTIVNGAFEHPWVPFRDPNAKRIYRTKTPPVPPAYSPNISYNYEGILWLDISNYNNGVGNIDLKYFDIDETLPNYGTWKSVFDSTTRLMDPAVYDPTNKRTSVFGYINDKIEELTGEYGTFLKHKANELTLIHVTTDEKTSFNQIISNAELSALLNGAIKTDLKDTITKYFDDITKLPTITSSLDTIRDDFQAHNVDHVAEADVIKWNNKADITHTHNNDGNVTIDAVAIVSGTFNQDQLPDGIKERIYVISSLDEFADTSITDEQRNSKYHNGNSFYLPSVDKDGNEYERWFKVFDQTKIGTSKYMEGLVEFSNTSNSLNWNSVTEKPTTLSGYGIKAPSKYEINSYSDDATTTLTTLSDNIDTVTEGYQYATLSGLGTINKIGFQVTPADISLSTQFTDRITKTGVDAIIESTSTTGVKKIYKTYYDARDSLVARINSTTLPPAYWKAICYGNGKFVVTSSRYTDTNSAIAYSTDGINWVESNIRNSTQVWSNVCYGNGKFIAIGSNGVFAYSTDGVTWTEGNISDTGSWGPVCYGNGKFIVMAPTSTRTAYSTDGVNWTESTVTKRYWRSVCYGKDKFVAVDSDNNYFTYSTDGITWTEGRITDAGVDTYAICYGNGKFVTVGYNATKCAYSTDGINWNTSNLTGTYPDICYGNNKFVAISILGSFAYSTDGINWTQGNKYMDNRLISWYCVCYGNNSYIGIGADSNMSVHIQEVYPKYLGQACIDITDHVDTATYFTDRFPSTYSNMSNNPNYETTGCGISYIPTSSTTSKDIYISIPITNSSIRINISYNKSEIKFKYSTINISREISNNLLESNSMSLSPKANVVWDMIGIKPGGTMPSNRQWYDVCYGNGKYIAVANGTIFAYSADGITWTGGAIPNGGGWYSVCYGNGKFVAIVWNTNVFAYSTDGITWTEGTIGSTNRNWQSVCYGNGKYVAVAYSSHVFAYSTNGITWTEGTIGSTSRGWYSVCYGYDKFVAVTNGTNIFAYSYDGITWTQGTISSTSRNWTSVCYGNDKFIAIAYGINIFAYSTNGITWTEGNISNTSRNWTSVCYGNGKYIAIAGSNSNKFAYSTNGTSWTEVTVGSDTKNWMSVCYGNGKYVAVARDSNIFAASLNGIDWI